MITNHDLTADSAFHPGAMAADVTRCRMVVRVATVETTAALLVVQVRACACADADVDAVADTPTSRRVDSSVAITAVGSPASRNVGRNTVGGRGHRSVHGNLGR